MTTLKVTTQRKVLDSFQEIKAVQRKLKRKESLTYGNQKKNREKHV